MKLIAMKKIIICLVFINAVCLSALNAQSYGDEILVIEKADSIKILSDGYHIYAKSADLNWIPEEIIESRFGPGMDAVTSCANWKAAVHSPGYRYVVCGPHSSIRLGAGAEIICGNYNQHLCAIVYDGQ